MMKIIMMLPDATPAQTDTTGSVSPWAGVIERSPLPSAITTGETHTLQCVNMAFEQLLHMDAQTLLQYSVGDVFPVSLGNIAAVLDQVFHTGEARTVAHQEYIHPENGTMFWNFTVWPILDPQNNTAALYLEGHETTEQVVAGRRATQLEEHLRTVNEQLVLFSLQEQQHAAVATHLALHDSLTGLPNRALFVNRLEQLLSVSHRDPDACAVLLLDMDRFKAVNDTLGHLSGDRFLQEIARRLSASVRPEDTVARLGGDEFALLLASISEVSEVMHVVERIHSHLNEPFEIDGQNIVSSASVGIVLTVSHYTQVQDLLHDADTALYRAKALGKAQSVIFDRAMHDQALALTKLETELRHAITHEEFVLHYQPIVSLHTSTIVGVEALLRWQHPTRGCLLPGEFLTVLEEAGLSISLGTWVLHTACAQMRAWQIAGLYPFYVAVNLSARQLQQHHLVAIIAQIIEQTGIAPQYLRLELTESSVMADVTASIAIFQELTTLGVQVLVDDFGTGYSSLSYLKRLPLTTVKIDRSFVDEIATNADDAAITTAIIAMAHQLKLQVVAEGVETEAQLDYLRANDCDAMQGYLFSRAIPAVDMTELLRLGTDSSSNDVRCIVPGG